MSNTEYFLDILLIVLAADLSFNLGLGAAAAQAAVRAVKVLLPGIYTKQRHLRRTTH